MECVALQLKRMTGLLAVILFLSAISFSGYGLSGSQEAAAQTSSEAEQNTEDVAASTEDDAPLELDEDEKLSTEELEQLVAPIALYQDALLSQVLMASTYPLEVVEADRWVKANPDIQDEKLEEAMVDQDWDSAIKALTAFPNVLDMMSAELSWTQQLGDAFLAQQEDVLAAVQTLRQLAKEEGNLESNENIIYEKQEVKTESGSTTTVIVAEPANPEVIYVPVYDPTVVYGTWRYPAYPPYYYYPPGYNVARGLFWFGVGYAVGNNWWGGCNWGRNNVNVNVNVYNKNKYTKRKRKDGKWKHDRKHRKGAPYRNKKVADRHGGRKRADRARAREKYRGRADKGRRDLAKQPRKRKKPDQALKKQKRQKAAKKATNRKKSKRAAKKRSDQELKKERQAAAKKGPVRKKKKAAKKRPPKKKSKAKKRSKKRSAYKGTGSGRKVKRHSNRGGKSRSANRSRKKRKKRGGGRRRG